MTDPIPVNLNKVRKARKRAADRAQADENAVRFGRTKADRDLDRARADKQRCDHDHKRIED